MLTDKQILKKIFKIFQNMCHLQTEYKGFAFTNHRDEININKYSHGAVCV